MTPTSESNGRINHVIVLMLENRSYDHVLGFSDISGANGLKGTESNPIDPSNPTVDLIGVSADAKDVTPDDPGHGIENVNVQLFGQNPEPNPPVANNNGFIKDYSTISNTKSGVGIMKCQDPANIPVLQTLARNFAVCDNWYSSVPGPTWPNRFFVHAATSDGIASNLLWHHYNMKTVYDNLENEGFSWKVYYHDIPQSLALKRLQKRTRLKNFRKIRHLFEDIHDGTLPNYSFIEPRYFNFLQYKANDQHPPHSMRLGEILIAEVYKALRANEDVWRQTLFIVLYDEHGGFYDHVSPPRVDIPNPDGKKSEAPPFDFTRLGLRVPAVLISPYISPGVISTQLEHASISAYLKRNFKLKSFLTKRDKSAGDFSSVISSEFRNVDLEDSMPEEFRVDAASESGRLKATMHSQEAVSLSATADRSMEPLSEFQRTLLELSASFTKRKPEMATALTAAPQTEFEAAMLVRERIDELLQD